jgi:CRISPR-associated protein Csm3
MHGRLYNELSLEIAIMPQTPLLIKSGQKASIDPALPDMQFVRTRRRLPNGEVSEVVYIPGSSLRGVIRAHAERLLRTLDEKHACYVEAKKFCLRQKGLKEDKEPADRLYRESCYACKLFGNTGVASRVQMSDLYPAIDPLRESRFGVAIDRITGAVAVGPFDLEVVTDARFEGRIVLRNFTVGQQLKQKYGLPDGDTLSVDGFQATQRDALYYQACSNDNDQIRGWLSEAAPRWVQEVSRAG